VVRKEKNAQSAAIDEAKGVETIRVFWQYFPSAISVVKVHMMPIVLRIALDVKVIVARVGTTIRVKVAVTVGR
jgi:hypothetical protein